MNNNKDIEEINWETISVYIREFEDDIRNSDYKIKLYSGTFRDTWDLYFVLPNNNYYQRVIYDEHIKFNGRYWWFDGNGLNHVTKLIDQFYDGKHTDPNKIHKLFNRMKR